MCFRVTVEGLLMGLAKLLLDHDADVNARMTARPPTKGTYDGNAMSLVGATPFFLAVKASDTALMRLLLDHGADPTIDNSDNTPPLLVAAGLGFIEGQVLASEAQALEAGSRGTTKRRRCCAS